jgi:prepilin-type N-terminal cleavage/methylation domain-containing protein
MPRISRQSREGFTLIELLVVVGIIAVLLGVLLPTLSKARQAAVQATCMSNQRQIAMALMMYMNEHKGFFPAFIQPVPTPAPAVPDAVWIFQYIPGVYMKENPKSFMCPADDLKRLDWMGDRGPFPRLFSRIPDVYYSYAYNVDLPKKLLPVYKGGGPPPVSLQAGNYNPVWYRGIRQPPETVAFFETGSGASLSYGTWATAPWYYRFDHGPRKDRMVVSYCDGHAGFITKKEIVPGEPITDTKLWPYGFRTMFFGRPDVDQPVRVLR